MLVIEKAKIACFNSNYEVDDYFLQVWKIVNTGVATKQIIDYKLTRYACYLIVQNGDSRKEVIARGQTYFAIQTRRQEISETEYEKLSEDDKRLYQRKISKQGNYLLQQVAKKTGVKKTWLSFIMQDTKVYIMVKQQMIFF